MFILCEILDLVYKMNEKYRNFFNFFPKQRSLALFYQQRAPFLS